ncbi:MAG: hypothetical protein LDL33_15785 [Desulfomonile sp.]|nr:hypothetical protein [Desulfomonile sp.]
MSPRGHYHGEVNMTGPIYLTRRELAHRWKTSLRTIDRMRRRRELEFVCVGRRAIRFPMHVVEDYERRHTHLSAAGPQGESQ